MIPSPVEIVGPSPLRLIVVALKIICGFWGAVLGFSLAFVGLNWLFSFWPVVVLVTTTLAAARVLMSLVGRGDKVEIGPEGFTVWMGFGSRQRRWNDISGEFAVIRVALSKTVAYSLTPDAQRRFGSKPKSVFSGRAEVISGAFRLSAPELASLLNQRKCQNSPPDKTPNEQKNGTEFDAKD